MTLPVSATLTSFLRDKRVVVTCGAGGVGKTTIAAALGLAGAKMGKHVLCLTIDPAKRLAQVLGLNGMKSESVQLEPSRFVKADLKVSGSLTCMMLDTKQTFDDLILRFSPDAEKAQKLLKNRLYHYVSTQLAGTQEYMAMEKLVAVKSDKKWDLIVLDTPPTPNALDFLDAPERLIHAIDSPAMRWFIESVDATGSFSLNLVKKSAATLLKGIGKITGGDFLETLSEFIAELNHLFGGFRKRAELVQRELRQDDSVFVIISSPSLPSLKEALYFSKELEKHGMFRGAFVVNRYRGLSARLPEPIPSCSMEEIGQDLQKVMRQDPWLAPFQHPDFEKRFAEASYKEMELARVDERNIQILMRSGLPIRIIDEQKTELQDLPSLGKLADLLLG